jgi:hypothetical protein
VSAPAGQLYVARLRPSCPAGTSASAWTTTPLGIANAWLWHVEIKIPAGHSGQTGIALVDSGTWVLPYQQGGQAWINGDDDLLEYVYGEQIGANVVMAMYNTGVYSHLWEVRLLYTPVGAVVPGESVLLSSPATQAQIEQAGAPSPSPTPAPSVAPTGSPGPSEPPSGLGSGAPSASPSPSPPPAPAPSPGPSPVPS